MSGLEFISLARLPTHPQMEGNGGLKRQDEIKHKMNDFEGRWEGIETQNATWWEETSDNLKKEFRPEVLEKLKDLPLFSPNLPPLDTKFDPNNLDTKGIVLTNQEKEAVADKIKRFNEGVGHANKWWGEIQNDIKNMKLSPQEMDELKKTESSLLFTDKLPPSRHKAKTNYKLEQDGKKAQELQIRKEQEKKDFSLKISEALGTTPPSSTNLPTSFPQGDYGKTLDNPRIATPPIEKFEKFDIDQGLKYPTAVPQVLPPSLEHQPALTSSLERHLQPHTAVIPTTSGNFSNIPNGGITNTASKVALPLDSPPLPPQVPAGKY